MLGLDRIGIGRYSEFSGSDLKKWYRCIPNSRRTVNRIKAHIHIQPDLLRFICVHIAALTEQRSNIRAFSPRKSARTWINTDIFALELSPCLINL